ncbi:hypothetical protein QUF94_27445 [Peribacillus sp. NJ4]|uniref:hypothetical protein n=1 Tax=Peribacillus sp. NJ4 TaxID=3055862 RepID=UPI0025A27A76|nr:hypothetical protein [Peribacillus sp. NJ4]MDM5215058.1 hypothetical protein [Peribacillus sp. NJ4]
MSFPNIPNITPLISVTTGQTVPLLLASIALEELALAHIINAEAEKLQFVLGTLPTGTTLSPAVVSAADLLAIDSSVQRTLRDVIKKEMLLEFKFENVLDLIGATGGGGGGPTPATCGCGVTAGPLTFLGPISVTTVLIPGFVAASGTLDISICPNCEASGSVFDLSLTATVIGIPALGFSIDAISSVDCTNDVTIMGTGTVTLGGVPVATGASFTISINSTTGDVTVLVASGLGTLLSVTIPGVVAGIAILTCP